MGRENKTPLLNAAIAILAGPMVLALAVSSLSMGAKKPRAPVVKSITENRASPAVAVSQPHTVRLAKEKPHPAHAAITITSRNSPNLPRNPKGETLRMVLLADCIAFRHVWGKHSDGHRLDGYVFRKRLLYENFRLNACPIDESQVDELIALSGCDETWSAKRMQEQINAYLVKISKDPAGESFRQYRLGKYGFGWLGEPGDQSLDVFRFCFDLLPGQTLGDTIRELVPPDFEVGGVPLWAQFHAEALPSNVTYSVQSVPHERRSGVTREDGDIREQRRAPGSKFAK